MPYAKVGPFVNGAAPALSAANMDQIETQYDEAAADIVTHAALTTGTHGVGGSTIASTGNITTHAALTTGVHGVGGGTIADVADIAATKIDDLTQGDDNTDLDSSAARHGLLKKLDGVATNFLNGAGNWSNTAVLTQSDTEVFNATMGAATTWQDLDLSGVVGSNVALVMIKITIGAGGANSYAIRRNGDADQMYGGANQGMACASNFGAVTFQILMCFTDGSGVIEHICNQNANACVVDLIGYIV